MDGWVSACGIRFWGEGQVTQGAWMMGSFTLLFVLVGMASLGLVIHVGWRAWRDRDVVEAFLALLGTALTVLIGVFVAMTYSQFSCLAAW